MAKFMFFKIVSLEKIKFFFTWGVGLNKMYEKASNKVLEHLDMNSP